MLRDFLDPKDLLVAWACQEHPEKKVCLAFPAHRASLAYLERKEQKERKDRRVHLALEFLDCRGSRETKGWQAFPEAPEIRGRKEAPGSQGCLGLRAPRAPRAVLVTQEALGCLERKVTKVFPDWMASLASKEKQVFLDSLAPRAPPARKESPAVTESRGRQERRVNQVYLEEGYQGFPGPKERKVQRATWVSLDWLGVQEFLDPKESKDSWVLRGHRDSRDCQEPLAVRWRGPKETEDRRDSLGCQGFRDPWGLQGSPGLMD